MLIDSDVLVWLTRGHLGAAKRLQEVKTWRISVVTYMELAQGCRNAAELARLKKALAARSTEMILETAVGRGQVSGDAVGWQGWSREFGLGERELQSKDVP